MKINKTKYKFVKYAIYLAAFGVVGLFSFSLSSIFIQKKIDAAQANPNSPEMKMLESNPYLLALLTNCEKVGNFNTAITKKNARVANLLLEKKTMDIEDPNCPFSPLFNAVLEGDRDTAVRLIKLGAKVNPNLEENDKVGPPIWAAAMSNRSDMVALLLENGADLNLHRKGSISALTLAKSYHRTQVEEYLREHGAKEIDESTSHRIPSSIAKEK